MNNAYGLLAVQEANLKILKEIDRICEKYRIAYVLDSGTLLGAIRHGGFIPWDDDADITMTRNNWEAFRKVAARELPESMSLLEPESFDNGRKFYDFVPRIIYNFSRRRKPDTETEFYEEKMNHLWVDIFIRDRLPDNAAAARELLTEQKAVYALGMGHRWHIDYKKFGPALKAAVFGSSTAGRLLPMRQLFRFQKASAKKANKKKTAWWYYSNYDPGWIEIKLRDEWVQQRIRIRFEDTTLSIPAHYDEVLKCIYGDYMKLPPKEERVPTHESTAIEIYG